MTTYKYYTLLETKSHVVRMIPEKLADHTVPNTRWSKNCNHAVPNTSLRQITHKLWTSGLMNDQRGTAEGQKRHIILSDTPTNNILCPIPAFTAHPYEYHIKLSNHTDFNKTENVHQSQQPYFLNKCFNFDLWKLIKKLRGFSD